MESGFVLDKEAHRIISGAMHYFRHHPHDWPDRLRKARLMGLNAIETYVPWNAHEPAPGTWDFSGGLDLGAFIDAAAEEGLHVIVRPGPFICAEWTNGGLPVWVTATPGIRLRTSDPRYFDAAGAFLRRVYEEIVPRQIDQGGNVILLQIENEYGSYGSDAAYLADLVDMARDAGVTVPLITVDTAESDALRNGTIAGAVPTLSFGSRPAERLALLREHHPHGPAMVTEFWISWFDSWGGVHHVVSPDAAAADLDVILSAGASVNIFPFSGGTNFGLSNGANDMGRFAPVVTSYDYDAPLDEAGEPAEKYFAFREVISRHAPVPAELPERTPAPPAFVVPLESTGDWLAGIPRSDVRWPSPPTFEELGPDTGLVLYAADVDGAGRFEADEIRDAAWFSLDGQPIGRALRSLHQHAVAVPRAGRLDVLVEDQGRIHYGPRIGESKGLIGATRVEGARTSAWTATPIDVRRVAASVAEAPAVASDPARAGTVGFRAVFDLPHPQRLFFDTAGWGKGYAFLNGFLLGRYWEAGPQRTLYVPAGATRSGENLVVLVELEHIGIPTVRAVSAPLLGHREQ